MHFAQLVGQRAPVHIEVVGQLLAVKGDGEAVASAADGLVGQIGRQPPSDGFGGGVKNFRDRFKFF